MDEILRTAIDKHKALILEPRIIEVINGKSLLEAESETRKRIDYEFYNERSGKLHFPFHFDSKFTELKKNHPELSLEETVLFAAKRELKEWNNRREAIVWFGREYKQIVDDYALLLAYREIYDLHYKTIIPFEGVSEFDSLRDVEELEDHTHKTPDKVSSEAKKEPTSLGKGTTKKPNINNESKNTILKLKWHKEEQESLKILYSALICNDNPLIICPDFLVFEKHFYGKKVSQKIIWLESLGVLIYLMDNLSEYIDDDLYIYNRNTGRITIKACFTENFCLKKGEKIINITENSIYDGRSRFLRSLENDEIYQKKSKNIDTIIQSLK